MASVCSIFTRAIPASLLRIAVRHPSVLRENLRPVA
jgi:hypothetical protein